MYIPVCVLLQNIASDIKPTILCLHYICVLLQNIPYDIKLFGPMSTPLPDPPSGTKHPHDPFHEQSTHPSPLRPFQLPVG